MMQTIKIKKNIDKQCNTASFCVDAHEIATIKQNSSLPLGFFKGNVRGFGELFSYQDDFNNAVQNVMDFIKNTFSHEFGIDVQFID